MIRDDIRASVGGGVRQLIEGCCEMCRQKGRLFAVMLFALLVASACGSEDGTKAPPPTPSPIVDVTPAAVTPVPTPEVVDGRVKSIVGYEATIPSGWRLRANILTSSDYRGDAYFKPDAATPDPDRPAANIAVGCRPILASPGTLDEVVDDQVELLSELRREDIRTSPRAAVDGREARQIDYVFRLSAVAETPTGAPGLPNIVLDKRDVIVVSDGCVWTISLSTPQGAIEDESVTFEQFLQDLKLTQ